MPKMPLKVHSRWPIPQRYMQVKGPSVGRVTESYSPLTEHPDGRYKSSEYSLREGKSVPTEYLALQGPWLPDEVERPRQAVKRFQEEYEDGMRKLREIDAYNRRAQVWNEYASLPRRARQFYPNRDDIARYLVDYEYIPNELEAWKTTRDLRGLDSWSRKNWGEDYPMQDLDPYEGPTDIPPEFIDEPPWRMW